MIYSIVVWGFDNDNDYQHDCDLIKAKSFKEAFEYTINYMWAGWTFTKIEIAYLGTDTDYIKQSISKRYHIMRKKLKKMHIHISIVFQMFLTLH